MSNIICGLKRHVWDSHLVGRRVSKHVLGGHVRSTVLVLSYDYLIKSSEQPVREFSLLFLYMGSGKFREMKCSRLITDRLTLEPKSDSKPLGAAGFSSLGGGYFELELIDQ